MYPKFIAKALFIPLFISICVMTLSACEQNSKEPDTHQAAISSASTPDDLAYQTFLSSLAKNQVLPAYQQLEQAANSFKQTLQTNCNTVETAEPKWSVVQAKWVALNRTWQTIQWLRLGPIKGSNLHSRIQYWPDANGAVERGVGQLFAKDPSPSLSQLSQMNVGAQGLPAAELILFSQLYQAADMQATRCELLLLIATNITEMAKKVSSEWQMSADFYSQFV
ncbi:MAG: hypothetical protein JKY14_08210 [Paraglaciecola sp.]|nr:hypothetical protein [Paraglaciecola sp.]